MVGAKILYLGVPVSGGLSPQPAEEEQRGVLLDPDWCWRSHQYITNRFSKQVIFFYTTKSKL